MPNARVPTTEGRIVVLTDDRWDHIVEAILSSPGIVASYWPLSEIPPPP